MMQINRLLETLLILLCRKKITAKELAARFDVSMRTIYRDIDSLSLSGIPVYSVKGKNGGIFLDSSFTLDQALLNNKQQEDVLLALNLLKSLGILETDQLLSKFESAFDLKDWIDIELSDVFFETQIFIQLKKAILLARKITFTFYTHYGQTRLITAHPLKIIFKRHNWFLLAYVPEQENYRLFPLTSVKSIELLKESFHPEFPKNVNSLFDSFKVSFQFSKRISYKLYDQFLYHEVQINPDGSYTITFEFSTVDDIYGFILPFGKNIRIIEPVWVKDEICQHTKFFLENNL